MGKLRSNKAVGDLQGTVGDLVYVHGADGIVVVRRTPERRAEFNAGETLVVQVTATDRPGNAVTTTVHHALIAGA